MAVSLNGLQPWAREPAEYAVAWARYYGVPVRVTSVYRSYQRQAELYAARRTNPYPVNPPGQSAHNYGLAWDSVVPDEYREWWIAVRQALGWEVPASDWIHAQVPGWRGFVQLAPR